MNVFPDSSQPTQINSSELTLIGKPIAKSSISKVFVATWRGKNVVVKQIRLVGKDPHNLDECRREAALLHQAQHPNIVGLCGVCDESSRYWLVLEHVAKGALSQVLASQAELSEQTCLSLARDMTSGLNFLHGKNILHRDIKSPNILVDDHNCAKLADFGLAKLKEQIRTQTKTEGTYRWCAPELMEDSPKFSQHSDVYALGLVFWELFSRQIPFNDITNSWVIKTVSQGKRPEIPINTPAPFSVLIRACWQQQADARPLCLEILSCLKTINSSTGSASAASAAAAAATGPAASFSATSFASSPSQGIRTVGELLGVLESLTSNAQVKADNELMALFTDKIKELADREETDLLKDTDKPFCRVVQRLLDKEGKINESFKGALLKTSAPNLLRAFPTTQPPSRPAIAFGAVEWNTYFGDVGAEPPLPPNINEILNAPCPYWPGKKVSETHMLVLIPEKVNGRPLTLTTLGELVKAPKQGNASKYDAYCPHTYGNIPAPTSHWILMTRDVIPDSRAAPFAAQKMLLKRGYTVPKLLDATIAIFGQNVSRGSHGYGQSPWTYTRCEELFKQWQMDVGGLTPGGLTISSAVDGNDSIGLAAVRKLDTFSLGSSLAASAGATTLNAEATTCSATPLASGPAHAATTTTGPRQTDPQQPHWPPAPGIDREVAEAFASRDLRNTVSSPATSLAASPAPVAASSSSATSSNLSNRPAIAFGAAEWNAYFGDVGVEPPLPPNINEILNAPCPFLPRKKISETHLLTLIPTQVNGKPFCLDALRELVKNPKRGLPTDYRYYSEYIKPEDKKSSPDKAYWVLMAKEVILGSRNKTYQQQSQYPDSIGGGYKLPRILEAATSILMEHAITGTRLYDNPLTHIRCQEIDTLGHHIGIGAFSQAGIGIWKPDDKVAIDNYGVALLRKLD